MTTYTLTMRDDASVTEERTITAETLAEAIERVADEATDWVSDGEWGDSGASVNVRWSLTDESGDEVASDWVTVDVEPDREALAREAADDPDCDHDWTREGEGGCAENPGVFGGAGTALSTSQHCRHCGLREIEHHAGSQRNPGQPATRVYYEQMDREEIARMRRAGHMDEAR